MIIENLNHNYTCSTLVLGSFYSNSTLKEFIVSFVNAVEKTWDQDFNDYNEPWGLDDYAFIACSTYSGEILKHLKELGFYLTNEVHNCKNNTHVHFAVAEIPVFLKNLERVQKELKGMDK